ncbi:MAG: glycoside hydrolase family 43, partial [Lachnospiraceae bacterium]|nr:glycoside hydrolase family 43 [Lachnospiraceae bacterium]
YKVGEYYYLFIIASPSSGWFRTEVCYRSKKLVDSTPEDWEEQVVYSGSTYEYGTGLAQGGIVDTIYGDWYGVLFQDHDAIGRIPSILAVNWDYTDSDGNNYKDWPMMGTYDDNGEFHANRADAPMKIRLNNSGKQNYIVADDDFTYAEGDKLKLVWQWNHNPDNDNWSVTENPGYYRITNGRTCSNIWYARNSLTQRTVGPAFTSETSVITSGMKPGDYAGLVAVGSDYGMVGVKCDDDGKRYIFQGSGQCARNTPDDTITENAEAEEITGDTPVYLKVEYKFNTGKTRADKANFFYSLDGATWTKIGKELSISFSTSTTFMGTRTWLAGYATQEAGGYVDFDYYKQYQED